MEREKKKKEIIIGRIRGKMKIYFTINIKMIL